jgi:hypothetical protein
MDIAAVEPLTISRKIARRVQEVRERMVTVGGNAVAQDLDQLLRPPDGEYMQSGPLIHKSMLSPARLPETSVLECFRSVLIVLQAMSQAS